MNNKKISFLKNVSKQWYFKIIIIIIIAALTIWLCDNFPNILKTIN